MTDWITGGQPQETPLEAATPGYEKIAPSFGEAFSAQFQQNSTLGMIGRALDRGEQQGASLPDQALTQGFLGAAKGQQPGPALGPVPLRPQLAIRTAPAPTPVLPAAEINRKYAPEGTTITNTPMTEGLAQVVAQQKADQIQRDGVLQRYSQNTNVVSRFGTGAAAFMLDPLNLATSFVPGVGEDAIAAKFGYATARAAPVGVRVAARVGAGATAGIAAQAPLSAIRYGLSQEEDGDYGLRQAMSDMAFGGALGAVMHAGLGGLGDLFHRPDPTLTAPPAMRHAATGTAVSQMVDGRPIDVRSIFDEGGARSTAEATELRQRYAGIGVTPEQTEALASSNIAQYRYANSTQSRSIFQAMREAGGLKVQQPDGTATPGPDVQGALEGVERKPPGLINNKTGLTPERMHEALAEKGWFGAKDEDPEALVKAIERQGRGETVLHPDDEAAFPSQQRASMESELARAGVAGDDDLATAGRKLGNWRGEQAMEDLKAQADHLGVSYHALTSPEDLLGDVLEREAIQHEPLSPAELSEQQQRLYDNGYAQGIPQAEFDRMNDQVYGPKEEEKSPGANDAAAKPKAESGGEKPRTDAEVDLAEMERHWAASDQHLLPEERAELEGTAEAVAQAEQRGRGLDQAASCLGRAGV